MGTFALQNPYGWPPRLPRLQRHGGLRCAGAAWVMSGAAALLLFSSKDFWRRGKDAFLFTGLASAMNLYWIHRNTQAGATAFGRSFHLTHFWGGTQAASLLTASRLWTWRLTEHSVLIRESMRILSGLLLTVRRSMPQEDPKDRALSLGARLALLYAFVYLGFLACAVFQGDLFIDSTRILIPFHLLSSFLSFFKAAALCVVGTAFLRPFVWAASILCLIGGARRGGLGA